MITSNFHTHTLFCDGKDAPEELVQKAIELGFTSLGFSGHSYFYPDREYSMSKEAETAYRKEIALLKEKYRNKIKLFCGIEQDYFSAASMGYDYIIGSVHNVLKNGEYLCVDASPDILKKNLAEHYNDDFDAFAEDYFATVADVVNRTNADIIGHIDLISKFSEQLKIPQTKRYLAAAESAVKALVKHNVPFEINTGAIARGYRTTPYPSPEILEIIKRYGGKIAFSSDCHDKNFLNCGFDLAEQLALSAGFTEHAIITEQGIEAIPI